MAFPLESMIDQDNEVVPDGQDDRPLLSGSGSTGARQGVIRRSNRAAGFGQRLAGLRAFGRAVVRQTVRHAMKSKLPFCLGCCSCLLVVVVVALLSSTVTKMPVVFLNMGEMAHGQIDVVLKARPFVTGVSREINDRLIGDSLGTNSSGDADTLALVNSIDYGRLTEALAEASRVQRTPGAVDALTRSALGSGIATDLFASSDDLFNYNLHSPRWRFTVGVVSLAACTGSGGGDDDADSLVPLSTEGRAATQMTPNNRRAGELLLSSMRHGQPVPPSFFEPRQNTSSSGSGGGGSAAAGDGGPETQQRLWSSLDALPPCWSGPGVRNGDACSWIYDGEGECDGSGSSYGCFETRCPDFRTVNAALFGIDPAREQTMQLGRGWRLAGGGDESLAPEDCWLQGPLAASLAVGVGDVVALVVNPWRAFGANLWHDVLASDVADGGDQEHRLFMPCRVTRVYPTGSGKLSAQIQRSIMVNFTALLPRAALYASPRVAATHQRRIALLRSADYTPEVALNLAPKARLVAYVDADSDRVQARVSQFAARAAFAAGFASIYTVLPVVESLANVWAFSMLLGLLVDIIAAVLVALTGTLIYSLLAVNVQTRAFEMGVLRLLGAGRPRVVTLLLGQALAFALPATIVGLVVAQGLQVLVATAFSSLSGVAVDAWLTGRAVAFAVALGLGVPAVSAVAPIRSALQRQVLQALDSRTRGAAGAGGAGAVAAATIERSELPSEAGAVLPWPLLLAGGMLALFGFAIYYVLPLALLERNIELLLNVFVALLMGMLVGLTMFSLNVAYPMQRLLIAVLVAWWESTAARILLTKHLYAHQLRNRKTMIMFALSVGFIVFLSVAAGAQVQLTSYKQSRSDGAPLLVESRYRWILATSFYERTNGLAAKFHMSDSTPPPQFEYGWLSSPLKAETDRRPSISSLGGAGRDGPVHIHAVSPNYFNATDDRFLDVDATLLGDWRAAGFASQADALGQLLHAPNCTFLGTTYRKVIGLELGDQFLLSFGGDSATPLSSRPGASVVLRVCAFLRSAPGLSLSGQPSDLRQDVLVSLPLFASLWKVAPGASSSSASSSTNTTSVDEILLDKFMTRPIFPTGDDDGWGTHNATSETDVLNQLARRLSLSASLAHSVESEDAVVVDVRKRANDQAQQQAVTMSFFGFATLLCMIICFFSLLASTYINIHEQRVEIGVMRAIGLSRSLLTRVFIEEAFIVVLSSALFGLVIGSLVGYTLTLQQGVFAGIPMPFQFPTVLLAVIFSMALVLSILAACGPMYVLLQRQPTQLLRS